MWQVAVCRSLIEPAGAAIVLMRGVSSPRLIRGRGRRTKGAETAQIPAHATDGKPGNHLEAAGKNSGNLMLRQNQEPGSLAAMTATAEQPGPDLHDLRPISEAAEALHVSTRSIYNWIKAGRLTEYKTLGGGKRLVDLNELRRNLKQ